MLHLHEEPEIKTHFWWDREKKRSLVPGRIRTLGLSVMSRALCRCATTTANSSKNSWSMCCIVMVSPHPLGVSTGLRWKLSRFVLKIFFPNKSKHLGPVQPPGGEGSPFLHQKFGWLFLGESAGSFLINHNLGGSADYQNSNKTFTFIPSRLRFAPMMGLTMKTVNSKTPKTRPYSDGMQPFFSASCG